MASPVIPVRLTAALLLLVAALAGCGRQDQAAPPPDPLSAAPPEQEAWITRAVVARVPLDSLTPTGTYEAALERLADLRREGVTVVWLPERADSAAGAHAASGTDDQFRAFVAAAHQRGFHVIVDAPADSTLPADTLAARLVRAVDRFDIDGFHAARAEATPAASWRTALAAARERKPLLLLADGEAAWLREAGFTALDGRDARRALQAVWAGAPADSRSTAA